ncbi:MAG: hypothetical protein K0S06_4507 [Microvirga sp.]|nr:hypothetical protein [Microvirga sp.]
MREQHLDLFALAPGGQPLVLFGDGAGEVTCAFMDGARHLTGLHTGAASRLERAGVAVELTGTIAEEAVGVWRVPISTAVAATALQQLASWAGVVVLVEVIGEVGPLESAVAAGGLVDDLSTTGMCGWISRSWTSQASISAEP